MQLLSMVILVISANLDGLVIGFSYGLKKRHLPFIDLIIISLITFAGTLLSMSLGSLITTLLPSDLPNLIGSSIIIMIGLYGLIKTLLNRGLEAETEKFKKLNIREMLLLGVALAINNFALGIGSSIAGFNILLTSFLSLAICFMFLLIGNNCGIRCISNKFGKHTDILSNIIMIVLGILELFI